MLFSFFITASLRKTTGYENFVAPTRDTHTIQYSNTCGCWNEHIFVFIEIFTTIPKFINSKPYHTNMRMLGFYAVLIMTTFLRQRKKRTIKPCALIKTSHTHSLRHQHSRSSFHFHLSFESSISFFPSSNIIWSGLVDIVSFCTMSMRFT